MMNVINEIETLRNKKTPDEIEQLLVNGEFGEIHLREGYRVIGPYKLCHLVVEIYYSGFLKYSASYPGKLVVHHRNGDRLNDSSMNLKVMTRDEYMRMPLNPKNREDITASVRARTRVKGLIAYSRNPKNWKAMQLKGRALSVPVLEQLKWLCPEDAPEFFKDWFTVGYYAELSETSESTARYRLGTFCDEGRLFRRSEVFEGHVHYIFKAL